MTPQPREGGLFHLPANQSQDAVQPPPRITSGASKCAGRKAVRSALSSDLEQVTITGIMPGLQVRMTGVPVADWLCRCGHHERARGRAAVIALTRRVRVGICPHDATENEGRKAA
ncbi:hypothetical protein NGB36_18125 [Streptomyces sp. RB6PN25]|uniref:Uncharacterized protein n=1 Tax=Streptomyces humicola TaxID=2953240 RepID=A0ABT1PXR6_9ACTN|nr:hypothetical protein [Streptomyces humicola]MCQ4082466.1 hypothetical protein [Streptomyces humicola]